jgi:hypothetical protein
VAARDVVIGSALVLGFATFVTVHVALAARLVSRMQPRWRGLAAFLLPPLAPIWGYREGFRRSAILWVVSLLVYAAARLAAELVPG